MIEIIPAIIIAGETLPCIQINKDNDFHYLFAVFHLYKVHPIQNGPGYPAWQWKGFLLWLPHCGGQKGNSF